MNSSILNLEFDSEEEAEIIYKSIFIEHIDSQIKSRAKMEKYKNKIKIYVEAEELSILKASLYSYLRWISVAQNIYKIVKR
ncbi:KEOPS complex subunit Pcc1 [Methanocaldococcus indicus]|uniref:KEOPS complex subunit Pcc1 n=1 Tax=Methanocaldococcus indicus TaxID=213231 RepID=UPI003C6DB043